MHGDAWSPEDQQQDRDLHHARGLPRRPQDQGRVPEPRPLQVRPSGRFESIWS